MSGDECPCETKYLRLGNSIAQTFNEIITVLIILEYPPPLNPSNNDVMQGAGSIDACFTWHKPLMSPELNFEKNYIGTPKGVQD